MLAPLNIATCTDTELLKSEFIRAYGDHDTDRQIAVLNREAELGVEKPLAVKRGFYRDCAEQLDLDEEADAQGITTSVLLGAE